MRTNMYTKADYKTEIEKLILVNGYVPTLIAKKSYEIYMDHVSDVDIKMRSILLDVATMENGPEFEMTEEEFKIFLEEM